MSKNRESAENAHNKGEQDYAKHGGQVDNIIGDFVSPTYSPPSGYDKEYKSGWENAKSQGSGGKDSGGSSDSSDSGSGSSDACCYITTACLRALHLPEDSIELRAMKILTKDYILTSRQGKRDYILYGRIAPSIVKTIEARSDSPEIWGQVYGRLQDITGLVARRDYEAGYQSYKSLVHRLSEHLPA